MNKEKIGTLQLIGLVTGSMLGSGIILLPPLAYKMLGNYALFTWIFIFLLGTLFAYVFIKMSIEFPGTEGVSKAVGQAFGAKIKLLTSYFMILAVCTGPVAVMMLAGEYLFRFFEGTFSIEIYAFILIVVCFLLLMLNIASISKITLFLSFFIAIVLLLSSSNIILTARNEMVFYELPKLKEFGKTALFLFWAVVGWEVIGTYSTEVKRPKVTIKRAAIISYVIVTLIYFLTSISLQILDYTALGIDKNSSISLYVILLPLFKEKALIIITFIAVSLCICTYILFTGSCARLIQTLAKDRAFPKFVSKKTSGDVPRNAIVFLILVHSILLLLANYKILSIDLIVAYANVFFICNALLGIFSFIKLFTSKLNLIISMILSTVLIILLLFSSKLLLFLVIVIAIYTILKGGQEQSKVVLKK
jgi:APA family basic amino acid/polyamine antiporter